MRSKDFPRLDGVVAIVGLGTVVILRGLLVLRWCSTRVSGSPVDWDCGKVGAAATWSGTGNNGVEGFEEVGTARSDRDCL